RTPSGKDRCVHSLRWLVNLCRVILAASHWLSVPPANGESGAPCMPLAQTTVAGLIFGSALILRLATGTSTSQPCACGQGEGDGIGGREVAFTRWLEPRNR